LPSSSCLLRVRFRCPGETGFQVVGLSRRIRWSRFDFSGSLPVSLRRLRLAACAAGMSSPPAGRRFPVLAARSGDRAPLMGFSKIPSIDLSVLRPLLRPLSCEVAFTFRRALRSASATKQIPFHLRGFSPP